MKIPPCILSCLRWTARVIGGLVLLLVLAIAIGEGAPNPLQQPAEVNVSLAALIVMLIGQVVAWKREGIGGAMILLGFAAFAIANHGIELNAAFAPMLLTGLLYSFCGWASRGS
jgi:hypothetical protein